MLLRTATAGDADECIAILDELRAYFRPDHCAVVVQATAPDASAGSLPGSPSAIYVAALETTWP